MLLDDLDDIILLRHARLDTLFNHDRLFAYHPLPARTSGPTRLGHGPTPTATPLSSVPDHFLLDHGSPLKPGQPEGAENDVQQQNKPGDRAQNNTHERTWLWTRVQARVGGWNGQDDILSFIKGVLVDGRLQCF